VGNWSMSRSLSIIYEPFSVICEIATRIGLDEFFCAFEYFSSVPRRLCMPIAVDITLPKSDDKSQRVNL